MKEITVQKLKSLQSGNEPFQLIDVREPAEYDQANIKGDLIPLGTLPTSINDYDPDALIIVMCRSGMRSGKAVEYMEDAGFTNVFNLKGGILAYKSEIDPSLNAT